MTGYRPAIALLCVGLVLFAAFTPGTPVHVCAVVLDPVWDAFVPQPRVFVRPQAVRVDKRTRALLSVLISRPPPSLA